jgi:acyl-CoA synthetase (AMP-forming)/AMP-acid ligase II
MLVNEFLEQSAKRFPNKVALIDRNKRFTYSQLDKLSGNLAVKLLTKRLKKGERVAILLENSAEYVISFFAILKAAGVAVPLNTQLVPRELSYLLKDSSPKFIITDARYQSSLDGLIEPNSILFLDKLNLKGGSTPVTYNLRPVTNKGKDLAMILYTSGTTGKPKGVMLSHTNLSANANSIIHYLKLKPSDRMMVILPFYYAYGNSLLTTHVRVGATLVIDNRFLYPNVVLDTMEKEKITGLAGVPSNFAILLRKSALRKYKLSKLRYVTQAGSALIPEMIKEFICIFPKIKFYVMYGQTEATARLTYLAPKFLNKKIGSIGKAIAGVKIDILGEDGKKLGIGQIGEIVARGPNVMLGYWNSPEETKAVLRKEGLYTGDLARLDNDGFIYLVSRKKEMIKSGANRISPFEIEEVVCQMPGVLECAAVGIKCEILGEAIKLFVVKNGANITGRDIILFCKQNLASYKIPKEVKLVETIPKTSTGKIKRAELAKNVY